MTITPFISWAKGSISETIIKIKYSSILSLTLAFAISLYFDLFSITQIIILFLSFSLIITSLFSGIQVSKSNIIVKSILGKTLSHAGFGLFILSVIANATYSEEKIYDAKIKDILEINGHKFVFEKINHVEGENYNSIQAVFNLQEDNKVVEQFMPEIRFYNDPPTATSETSIV
jgi:cytochrome c-type biogenesis protein CcmF